MTDGTSRPPGYKRTPYWLSTWWAQSHTKSDHISLTPNRLVMTWVSAPEIEEWNSVSEMGIKRCVYYYLPIRAPTSDPSSPCRRKYCYIECAHFEMVQLNSQHYPAQIRNQTDETALLFRWLRLRLIKLFAFVFLLVILFGIFFVRQFNITVDFIFSVLYTRTDNGYIYNYTEFCDDTNSMKPDVPPIIHRPLKPSAIRPVQKTENGGCIWPNRSRLWDFFMTYCI